MNDSQAEKLNRAIEGLHLRDIMLFECHFKRPSMPDSKEADVNVLSKRLVRFVRGQEPTENEAKSLELLQVFVELGSRLVGGADKDSPIYFEIEAVFMAEYEVRQELDEEAVKVFAEINSVHNVWPFWRQHVFDTVQRARMPHIEIPLFAGARRRPQASLTADGPQVESEQM